MMQPTIILLREGTDASQGKPQLLSNINACQQIVEIVKTTLGPRGMDKLIHDGRTATVSNDGATIVNLLDIDHPAAKVVADIAKSQDAEVGDGTTSVMVLTGDLLKEAKQFVEDGVHPQLIIKGYRTALDLTLKRLDEIAIDIAEKDPVKRRENLIKCAETSLNSKLIGGMSKKYFGEMVVDAVLALDADMDTNLVGIKQVHGGAMQESFLVKGVAFKKTFSYAGFEQQPKSFENPKIILLNIELELKAEKDNAEIRLSDTAQYQSIVDAEWQIIYNKLDKIAGSGAKIVLSKLAIGDLATQYFADRGIFCAGRVPEDDLKRVAKATGAVLQTTVNNMDASVLGSCAKFEEKQLGNERYNLFTGCTNAKTATIILRGGAEQFIAEAERSLNDALQVVKRAVKNSRIIAGGGATEMEISFYLRSYARTIKGKQQLIINAFAKALEVIPTQLAENAGFDATDILNKLRQRHAQGDTWAGVDIVNDGVCDTMKSFVWEPVIVKRNYIASACEAASLVLSIDESVKGPKTEQEQMQQQQQEYAQRKGALKPKLVSR